MNCRNHPDIPAAAFCRECGKPLCTECERPALGSIYCAEHQPAAASAPRTAPAPVSEPSPYTAPEPVRVCNNHPLLAFLLGFIPGVGAIYNGQYAKGLIHAVVFGLLVSLVTRANDSALVPLLGISIGVWVFYMAFEAYHTAAKQRRGEAAEEFSSLIDVRPAQGRFPAGAVLLIVIGFVLLLDTTDLINIYQLERYWPLGLILLGVYMLYARVSDRPPRRSLDESTNAEARR
jgi:TM2 domain-containing membrane protein YozV